MIRRPPRSTRTDTLFPYTTLFRSHSALRGRGFSLGNGHDFSCILKNCVTNRLPGFVLPVAGNDWPARRAEAHSRPDGAGKIFRRKVPQRQMVSGAGSGAAIAFLPAKASPLRARTAAAHSPQIGRAHV